MFTIPLIERPVAWYGALFVLGFIYGYFYFVREVSQRIRFQIPDCTAIEAKNRALKLADRFLWLIIGGTILGARIAEVFFYSWDYYKERPEEIIKIWHGGLSSHGGTLGVIIALAIGYRFAKKVIPNLTFIGLMDIAAVPTGFVIFCIRMGNFVNQEIVGNPTLMPWGVIFGHPAGSNQIVPRHPVQLYEGFTYLAVGIFLTWLWEKKGPALRPGILSGIFLILVFGSRIFWEFFKLQQDAIIDQSFMQIGQYLSIPFVLLGIWLLCHRPCTKRCKRKC